MGNKALIPRISDLYDSGIDSDEGKQSSMNAVFIKDHEEVKIKSKNIFNKSNIPYEKLDENFKEVEKKTFLSKQKSVANGGKNYRDGVEGSDLNRPLLDSFKAHEQMRMTNVNPSDEKWIAYESDGRDSPQLYEVELTASDEDDSSVLELVIPMQSKIKRHHWLLEFLCFGCLYRYE
ncbi:uncharacterized protein LOC125061003 isoform X1 [Pieris napi]|uniref:uncharacterized protein LOC125061003 isoform X1 n=1 Tax=Pieris napi TaxID=78633 RepID=UPI001FB9D01D|nr:uncharacterized protein LOC125061003 isoform X1 [Pieris napi]